MMFTITWVILNSAKPFYKVNNQLTFFEGGGEVMISTLIKEKSSNCLLLLILETKIRITKKICK